MIDTIGPSTAAELMTADPYGQQFDRLRSAIPAGPAWLLALRQAAFTQFTKFGFPTVREEDWRFTNVAPIGKLPFRPIFGLAADGLNRLDRSLLRRLPWASLPGPLLVFVDGHFVEELSTVGELPSGVTVGSLANALSTRSTWIEKHLGRHLKLAGNSFAALNTAFFQDGALIHLGPGVVFDSPIRLWFINSGPETGATAHPRNLIVMERGSRCTVVEGHFSANSTATLSNAVTELVVGEGAKLEHCKLQDESPEAFHVAALAMQLSRDADIISHSFALGAKLSRHNLTTLLNGEGIECVLNGLYLTRGEQLADHHMIVEHAQPHCNSHEYFNGILDGRSKGVFHGRILVQPIAQKTDAKQTNKNLLLSDLATVDTKPQLEIYADDVKCTHGATVGQLDEESIFYLRARGIGLPAAKRMLIHAFAGEILDRIREAGVREELDQIVRDRLERGGESPASR